MTTSLLAANNRISLINAPEFLTMKTMAAYSRIRLHEKSIISNGDRIKFGRERDCPKSSGQDRIRRCAGHRFRDQPANLRRSAKRGKGRHSAGQANRSCFPVRETAFRAKYPRTESVGAG